MPCRAILAPKLPSSVTFSYGFKGLQTAQKR